MSNAKKCDICGKLYEYYDGVEIVEGGTKYNHMILSNSFRTKNYDLCKECMMDLIKILKKG